MDRWMVRSWIIEDGQEVVVDEGPWDRELAELVLADIGHDGTVPRGQGRAATLRSMLVRYEQLPDLSVTEDTLIEPRAVTGHGAEGSPFGRGRGPLTSDDKRCLLAFCRAAG